MIDLASHIEYLLMSHDCVVAPGLGAFLVHETPARYDAEACRFMPPMRSLGFNQAVTINDGLLSESVAKKEGVTLDAARLEVETAIASFRHQLELTGTMPVGNLGDMTLTDGVLVFEPSDSSGVAMRYMGLAPLDITPIATDSDTQEAIEAEAEARVVKIPVALKLAASLIIAVVACGIFISTGKLMNNRQSNFASLDSGLRTNVASVAPITSDETISLSREIELNISVPVAAAETAVAASVAPQPGRYLLVVGSFPTMKSALRHINGDPTLAVMEMDDKFRVYASSASTMKEATLKADSLRSAHPTVWVCRR